MAEEKFDILDSFNIFKQLRKAKDEATNPIEYTASAFRALHGSMVMTIWFILLTGIPIATLSLGIKYLDTCTIQKYIPIWLIVNGTFGLLTLLIRILVNVYSMIRGLRKNKDFRFNPFTRVSFLIEVFLAAWFICGNVWVYSIKDTVDFKDESSQFYCPRTPYLFAFWLMTLTYIIVPIMLGICLWLVIAAGLGYCPCLFAPSTPSPSSN